MPITSTILYNLYRDLKSSVFPSSTPKHISEAIESATANSSVSESLSESLSELVSESVSGTISTSTSITSASTSESLADSDFLESVLEAVSESHEFLGSATNSPTKLVSKLNSEPTPAFSSGLEMSSIKSPPPSSPWPQIGEYFTKSNLLIGGGMALITAGGVLIYINRRRIKEIWQNGQLEFD